MQRTLTYSLLFWSWNFVLQLKILTIKSLASNSQNYIWITNSQTITKTELEFSRCHKIPRFAKFLELWDCGHILISRKRIVHHYTQFRIHSHGTQCPTCCSAIYEVSVSRRDKMKLRVKYHPSRTQSESYRVYLDTRVRIINKFHYYCMKLN